MPFHRTLVAALLAASAVACASSLGTGGAAASSTSPPVAVYPIPGTSYAQPGTQITFRGIPASEIGTMSVVGSITGPHSGQIVADSDGNGGSFIADKPFHDSETVTVTTSLNVIGGHDGTFSFKVEHPSWPVKPAPLPLVSTVPGGLQQFRSRPDLLPPSVWVSRNSAPASQGDIFVAPQYGPVQNGPMILDPRGNLVWFDPYPVSRKMLVTDFRVQQLYGQPVLTWWQGYTNNGTGEGQGMVFDSSYHQVAVVNAGNGLQMDLHEFLITPQGQAYVLAFSPVSLPRIVHKPILDCVVQEIDIRSGLVLFEWHALDHIPLRDSYFGPNTPGYVFDPYHANSVGVDRDGNLIVSLRNTSAVYKVDRSTGRILWQLGGKHSSFRMGRGTSTAFQHDAEVQPDGTVTIFDDGAGPPILHTYSRGIRVAINAARMTANLVRSYDHAPQFSSYFEGNVQQLPGGDVFLGWGQQPYFSEDDGAGHEIFDAHFFEPSSSYRAYRFQWNGQPATTPALAIGSNWGGTPELYASWNGATNVAYWRVLAGSSPDSLTAIGKPGRSGFETAIAPDTEAPYLAVQPLDAAGNLLTTSNLVAVPRHVAIYGGTAFVSAAGWMGALPVGCFTGRPCKLTTTLTSGRTVLAHSGAESVGSGGGLAYFRLSPGARRALPRAHGGLRVQASVRDASGIRTTTWLNLISFSTAGRGPRRSLSHSPLVSFVGMTDFVNARGIGGILASCHAPVSPCSVKATLSVGRTVIAQTGRESLGAGDLGYVMFTLTGAGRSMLAHARGNQLGAQVTLTGGSDIATGAIALVRF